MTVYNNSSHKIRVLGEHGGLEVVEPGGQSSGRQDGFSIQGVRPGQCYKTTDFVDAIVTNSSVNTFSSVTDPAAAAVFMSVQAVKGGWKAISALGGAWGGLKWDNTLPTENDIVLNQRETFEHTFDLGDGRTMTVRISGAGSQGD
jgi:hypothetical protein